MIKDSNKIESFSWKTTLNFVCPPAVNVQIEGRQTFSLKVCLPSKVLDRHLTLRNGLP